MVSLQWSQVNAWRLAQHCLSPRAEPAELLKVVRQTGGIQAQVISAAGMALGARIDGLTQGDIQSALWQERSLVKTWAMRATLHLITASDFPIYAAARSLSDTRNWPGYFTYYGVSQQLLDEYLAAAPGILSDIPLRREEFARVMSEQLKSPELYNLLAAKGWGTPLKVLAWRGDLCFGPNQGQNVTFVNPHQWLGKWSPCEPYAAMQEVARRYLTAYGPATVEDFALWWGDRLRHSRKLFRSLEPELEEVDVEGWRAYALRSTVEPMQGMSAAGVVNLLPLFDAYLMGIGRGKEIEPLLPGAYQKLVFRPQGWISAVVLADGAIMGTWEYLLKPGMAQVKVNPFTRLPSWVKDGITAEAERLGAFLNTSISVEYSPG